MKNVTITLDDETHRMARIKAAERGTSLSALVKDYLTRLADEGEAPMAGVREMQMPYTAQPPSAARAPRKVFTKDGKPRQPGALRGKIQMADDFDTWPDDVLASFEAWDYGDPAPPK